MAQSAVLFCSAVLFALVAAAAAQSPCKEIPSVGLDQSPGSPAEGGKCNKIQKDFFGSHWCKHGKVGTYPGPPPAKAQQCLKYGRASIYRGPIYGSSSAHKAACNKVLMGDDKYAMVAVSTKYLKTYQGGWTADQGACNKCMCVRMHGGDDSFNGGLQKEAVNKRVGLTFMAKVGDRCSECPDDQIDILQDRPFSWAPFDPKKPGDNPNAKYVNARDGLRGFRDPDAMRNTGSSPESVGTWTTNWQWVPCEWDHAKCADMMKGMGFENVYTPSFVEGHDSFSLRPMASLRTRPFGEDPLGKKK